MMKLYYFYHLLSPYSFPSRGRNHSQGAAVVCAAGDPGSPRFCQLSALRARVRDGRHILLLSERHGEHRGRRGDQAILGPGAGKLEPADSQQLSIPSQKPESDRPVGPGGPHPLRRPAAPQVRAAHTQVVNGCTTTSMLHQLCVLCAAELLWPSLESVCFLSSRLW